MMINRIFTIFSPDTAHVAMFVNTASAVASALTIAFLFWTIAHLGRRLIRPSDRNYTPTSVETAIVMAAAFIGSMAYAFTDTFWFSAIEGEVYAQSSLFTALVFWTILKWENVADQPHADRWLVLLAYLMGLSIGVHLLNLLAIPAIVLVYYYRTHDVRSRAGWWKALGVSVVILGAVLYVIIPGTVRLGAFVDRIFVNGLDLPVNSVAPRLRSLPRPDERTQSAQYRPIMHRCHCDRLLHLRIRSDTLCGEPSHELELSGRSIPVALVPQPRAIRQPAPFQRTILFGAGHRRDKKEELLLRRRPKTLHPLRIHGRLRLRSPFHCHIPPHVRIVAGRGIRALGRYRPAQGTQDKDLRWKNRDSTLVRRQSALFLRLPAQLHVLALFPVELRRTSERPAGSGRNNRRQLAVGHKVHR